MKRKLALLLAAAMLFSLTACGTASTQPSASGTIGSGSDTPAAVIENTPDNTSGDSASSFGADSSEAASEETPASVQMPENTNPDGSTSSAGTSQEAPTSSTQTASSQPEPAADSEAETPRILIAYFTWADNTHVDDPSSVDVDASTSASVLAPGNAAQIASWIQQEVGGDLFSIVVADLYSSDYDECLDRAADEKADNARPALTTHVSGMDDYDIVFLGFPNWWYTLPMAVLSFVDEYDFSGKTVVPFVTHGTGGLASTIQDLTAALPDDVTIMDTIGIYRPEVDQSRPAVQRWLDGLDLD